MQNLRIFLLQWIKKTRKKKLQKLQRRKKNEIKVKKEKNLSAGTQVAFAYFKLILDLKLFKVFEQKFLTIS